MIIKIKNILIPVFLLLFINSSISYGAIIFADDVFENNSESFEIGTNDDADIKPLSLSFGGTNTTSLVWNTSEFQLLDASGDRANLSFEIETVSALPGGAGGLGADGEGRLVILDTADNTAPGCNVSPNCSSGTYIWDGASWQSLIGSPTSTNLTKVVTVASSGADYTTIADAASYLQTRSGGIMLLSAEVHAVTTAIDMTNIQVYGKDASNTSIQISGAGQLDTFDTLFEFLTLDIDSITDSIAMDVQTGANSLTFNFVDFNIQDSGDVLIDSNSGTAPTVTLKFIKSNFDGGSGVILDTIAGGNLNAASDIFIDSRSGDSPLEINDWDLILAGGGSVNTSGTITSVPAQSIFVSPAMNLQGAIDSLELVGNGGLITLLPGTHTISETLTIEGDDIKIIGYGDTSIISTSGTFASTGSTIGAIQIGTEANPNDGVVLSDFKLEVNDNIHGIRATGGMDNQIDNVTIQKMTGTSGSGDTTADLGILFMDGTAEDLVRPVIRDSRILGNGGAIYFTDGIHVTSNGIFDGVFGNGNNVVNALVEGNNVGYVGETAYAFVGADDSSLFNNRATAMGQSGNGYGIFMGDIENINMTANVFTGSGATSAIAIGIDGMNSGSLSETKDSIFSGNIIDGAADGGVGFALGFQIGASSNTNILRTSFQNNVISGASNAGVDTAFQLSGNADNNTISDNTIDGVNTWGTGISILSSSANSNLLRGNIFANVTNHLSDSGTATKIGVPHHRASSNPTVNDDIGDNYSTGTIWINTSTNDSYLLTDNTAGAANWGQINGSSGGGGTLDDAYNSDTGERTIAVDNGDISWDISGTNNYITDLQGTGSMQIQNGGVTFAEFLPNGDFVLGDGTANDVNITFDDGTNRNFGWDDNYSANHTNGTFSTNNQELAFRTIQSANTPITCSATVAGMQWIDTDTGLLYICDGSRNKWLSTDEKTLFGDESGACNSGQDPNTNANCNVDWGNGLGPDSSTLLGLYIPRDITITGYGFSADNDSCSSGSFDIEVWGTGSNADDDNYSLDAEIATGLTGQAHNANNLNINVAGDQYILWGIDNNCGQSIDDWNTILYFRYNN